jgi:hypothetical protein
MGAYLCCCCCCPRRRRKNAFIQGTRGLALRLLSCLRDCNPLIFPRRATRGRLVGEDGFYLIDAFDMQEGLELGSRRICGLRRWSK